MSTSNYTPCIFLLAMIIALPYGVVHAQSASDCDGAQVICTNSTIVFNPSGIGSVDDFDNPNNFSGCLASEENNAVWYYFEFDNNTLPGEIITFVISSNNSADYDFAVFGPGANCGALGGPIRCSYAAGNGDTGLDTGAFDNTEGAGGNGFVAPISVGPGQGYYLLIDNFSGNGQSFSLTWGGAAADNLNCNPCNITILGYTPSWQVCPGGSGVTFDISLDGTSSSTTYEWTSPDGGLPYLSNPFVLNPTVNIPAGVNGTFTYNLIVTDGTCSEQLTVTVTADGVPPLTITGDNEFCPGESVTLTVSPGNLPSYSWSNGGTGTMITVSAGGTYTVTATNSSNCTGMTSFTVTELPAPTVDITGDTEICPGESTTLTASAGFIGYDWNIGSATPSITVFDPGMYSVTATSAAGCDAVSSVQVTQAPDPVPTIDGPLTLCPGQQGVLNLSNGPFQSYLWSDGSSASQLSISGAGTYSVTVTNAQGCSGSASFTVNPVDPPVPQIIGDLAICPGFPGTLELSSTYQTYAWSTGDMTPFTVVPTPGTYSVTVTNAEGCTGTNSVNVTESIVFPPVIIGPTELCGNNGGILETTPDYATYSWSTGANQFFTSIPGPGVYSLTVTNADGCISEADYSVGLAPPLSPVITGNIPFCQGESITLGLNEAYASYSWSTGSTNPTTEVFDAGPVSVTVTDANGCTGTAAVNAVSSPPLAVVITGPDEVCPGSTVALNATSGYSSYSWSDGTVGPVHPAATAGEYSVTVADANGCTGSASFTLNAAPPLNPVIDGVLTFCEGGLTTLTVVGNYTSVSWSNNEVAPTIAVTETGNYMATVTDASGCTGTASAMVTALPQPPVAIDAPAGICWEGTALIQATPGYPTYEWSDFSSTQSFTQVTDGGSYSVTVTDASGCQNTASVVLDVFPPPQVIIEGPDVICSGNTGSLTAAGGPFEQYLWNTGASTDFLSVDEAGVYSLTVTDINGCTTETSTTVEEGDEPAPVLSGELLICDGGNTTLGTAEPYQAYEWSNGSTESTAVYDAAGEISLTVTNASGCSGMVVDTLLVSAIDTPLINGPLQACPGEALLLTVEGSYTEYAWSNGSSNSETTVNGPGTYSLTVTDSVGCELTIDYSVDPSPVPVLEDQDTSICSGDSLLLEGPAGFASYLWDDSLAQSDVLVTEEGTYHLVVTNAAGCQDTALYTLTENGLPVFSIEGDFAICEGEQTTLGTSADFAAYNWSNGANGAEITVDSSGSFELTVTDENGCQNTAAATVEWTALPDASIDGILSFCDGGSTLLSGQVGFSYSWSTGSTDQELMVDAPGTYILTVENNAGCLSTDTVTVQEVDELQPQINGPTAFCSGESISLTAASGYASYQWSNGANTAAITVDSAAVYSLSVTDANGCTGSTQVQLVENPLPDLSISAVDGFCDGEEAVLAALSTYESYSWSNGEAVAGITVSEAGMYSLTVTDINGCSNEASVTLSQYPLPQPQIQGALQFCPEDNSTLSLNEAYAGYVWSDGSNTPTITIDESMTFAVSVTDQNGCTAADTVTTVAWPSPEAEILGDLSFCEGFSTTLQSNTVAETYSWSTGGDSATETISAAGSVTLTVVDSNGCAAMDEVSVASLPLPQVDITGAAYYCAGDSTQLSASPGYASYVWSTTDSTQALWLSAPAVYQVTVTDNAGCQNEASFELEEIPLPTPAIVGELQFCPGNTTTLAADQNYTSYQWSDGSNTPSITTGAEDSLTLLVANQWGCSGSASVELMPYETSVPQIDAPSAFCPGDSVALQGEPGFTSYLWSNNSTQPTLNINSPGQYSLSVTDDNGCGTENAVSITHFSVSPPQITGPDAFCEGEQVNLQVSTEYLTYEWSNGAESDQITVDTGGVFRVSVTDVNGCNSQSSFQLLQNNLPDVVIGGSSSFCPGGFASLNAGGMYATYEWSDGSTASSIQVGEEGSYSLTVTDDNGCVNSASISVSEQSELTPVIAGSLAFCPGTSTTLNAGAGFLTYAWSDGSSGESITVEEPGVYSLSVEDASGCSGTAAVTVETYLAPEVAISGPAGFCEGATATLMVQGANIADYEWSTGGFEAGLEVNTGGMYTVIATDINGCVDSASVEMEVYPLPAISIDGQSYFCEGGSTTLSGPSGYASYSWNNGATEQAISAAQAGTYAIAVTDSNGCTGEAAVGVQQIPLPVADAGSDAVINCLESSIALGGPATSLGTQMVYSWTGPGLDNSQLAMVQPEVSSPGTYLFTVTDTVYGCQSLPDEVFVEADTSSPQLVLQVNDTLDCVTNTVKLDGSASDSGPDIQYAWYNGLQDLIATNTETLEVQDSGTYFLELVDMSNGCRQMDDASVAENRMLPGAEAGAPQRLDCANTSLEIEGTPGVLSDYLEFEWTNSDSEIISTGTQATVGEVGVFYFRVLNLANGCTSTDSVEITADFNYPIADAGEGQSIDCLSPEATLDGSASSQGSEYSVQWAYQDTTNIVEEDSYTYTATAPGAYYIIITNLDNSCVSTAAVEIVENNAAPSGLLYEAEGPTCFGDTDGSITLSNVEGGTAPYLYSFNGAPYDGQTQFENLEAGTYTLAVQDLIGCEYSIDIVLEDGNDLWVEAGQDIEAQLGETVQLAAEVSVPSTAIDNIAWEGLDSLSCGNCLDPALSPSASALYTITVTDENGCTASDQVHIFLNTERNIYMPSAFSPNGDDKNDRFYVQGGAEVAKVRMLEVYSRWGGSVFFVSNAPANDPTYGWDGSFNGEPMNSGVFVWQTEIEFVDGEVVLFKGEVLLLK